MKYTTKHVVDRIMAEDNDAAKKIFEQLVNASTRAHIEDMKGAIAQRMVESADTDAFIPEKQDFTVHAIDPTKASDRMPEGEPVQYKVNSYSHKGALAVAKSKGHSVKKVVDSTGIEVQLKESSNDATAVDVDEWKDRVRKAYPQHADNLEFKSSDRGTNISAHLKGTGDPDRRADTRCFGVYDVAGGKGHVLGEGTETGAIQQQLAAQKQQEEEAAFDARKAKAPTIQDVVSVLGNTVSVADQSSVQ